MGKELHSGESPFSEWGTPSARFLVGDGGRALDCKLLSPRESKAVGYVWLSRSFSMPMREFWAIEYSLIRVFITGKNEFFSLQQNPWPIHKDKFRYRSIFINFAFNMMIEGLHPLLEIFSICWKLLICSMLFLGNVLFTYTKYVHM